MSHWVSSEIAASYRAFRPQYPPALIDKLAEIFASFHHQQKSQSSSSLIKPRTIIDIGTGSGQAIKSLQRRFPAPECKYIGIDPSSAQLEEAKKEFEEFVKDGSMSFVQGDAGSKNAGEIAENIRSSSSSSLCMNTNLPADLVVIAQALHWFSIDHFCNQLNPKEGPPLLNPENGLIAAFLYPTTRIISSKECDKILQDFDKKLLSEGYWPKERWSIENHYRDQIVDFRRNGYELFAQEVISDERESSLEHVIQYLNTWSGVQRFEKKHDLKHGSVIDEKIRKPFEEVLMKGDSEWKDHEKALCMKFDFYLYVWKKV